MPAGVVVANVGVAEPLHPVAQVAIAVRPKHEVKVVGHEAPANHAHGHFHADMAHRLHELEVVAVLVEYLSASVASIE